MALLKTVLVTGGAGYIGAPLVGALLANSYKVVVVDNLSFGGESLLNFWHHPNFIFNKASITDTAKMDSIFSAHKPNAVVHLAAIVGDPACAKDPALAEKVNWDGARIILEISKKHAAERFVFASTCSNYGKMANAESFVTEESPLAPVSLYAELKVKFEKLLLQKTDYDDYFCPTVLRFATVYGLAPRMRFDLTVNEFIKQVVQGKNLEIFGEQFWRPYCHVSDFSRAIMLVLDSEKPKVSYNVFNVGDTAENYQKKMIADEIKKIIPVAQVSYVRKTEDPRDYRVSFEKIKQVLGFAVSRRVPDGIQEIKLALESGVFINPDDTKYTNC